METLSVDLQYVVFCICYDYNSFIANVIIAGMRFYVISYMLGQIESV